MKKGNKIQLDIVTYPLKLLVSQGMVQIFAILYRLCSRLVQYLQSICEKEASNIFLKALVDKLVLNSWIEELLYWNSHELLDAQSCSV